MATGNSEYMKVEQDNLALHYIPESHYNDTSWKNRRRNDEFLQSVNF